MSKIINLLPVAQYNLVIESEMSCLDCGTYAADMLSLFSSPPWMISTPKVMGARQASPTGISILTPDTNHPTAEAYAIIEALRSAKISFDIKEGGERESPTDNLRTAILITAKGL